MVAIGMGETSARRRGAETAIWRIPLADEAATERLAKELAETLHAGDHLTLSGDLGAGKTTFARALIRTILEDPEAVVPSPTFTLMQTYEGPRFPIVHFDLFRIDEESDLAELGWDEARDNALVLVEWPQRAGPRLPADRLDIAFRLDAARGPSYREAMLRGFGAFAPRLSHIRATHDILATSGWEDARRSFMVGDASTRSYERLTKPDGSTAILMHLPPRRGGPPVRYGKPYAAIARLSADIDAFIAIDRGLRERGFSAPAIHAFDRQAGLAVLEDLGNEGVVEAAGPIADRYAEAVSLLAHLHALSLPEVLPVTDGVTYAIPPFDLDALLIEVELLLEWYVPYLVKLTLTGSQRSAFANLWKLAIGELFAASPRLTWTLRDYHSPNLIWLPDRAGLQRVGLIDFQDCVIGPPAYDLAALLQDARVTVPDTLELKLFGQYAQARRRAEQGFDPSLFACAYAIAGAQRATKLLGLFTRLDRRDRKPQYLAHLPRIAAYLAKNLQHPALSNLKAWYETYLPKLLVPPS